MLRVYMIRSDNVLCDVLLQRQTVAKVEDLRQNGIDLELMHMSPSDRPFDIQAFYKVSHTTFFSFLCVNYVDFKGILSHCTVVSFSHES